MNYHNRSRLINKVIATNTMLHSNKYTIVTKYPGIAEYIKSVLIGDKAMARKEVDVEVVYSIDDPESQLSGRHVYCLEKASWGKYAVDVTIVRVDLELLGKPLSEASGEEIALTEPDIYTLSINAEDKNEQARALEKRFLLKQRQQQDNRTELPKRPSRPIDSAKTKAAVQ